MPGHPQGQRLDILGALRLEIRKPERRAGLFEIGGHATREVATVEIVETRLREMSERVGKPSLAQPVTGLYQSSTCCIGLEKPRNGRELRPLLSGVVRQRAHDGDSVPGVIDMASSSSRDSGRPAAMSASGSGRVRVSSRRLHRPRSKLPGDRVTGSSDGRLTGRIPASRVAAAAPGIDAPRTLARHGNEPEIVASETVHMRIGHDDGGCRRHHRFEACTIFLKYAKSGSGREIVRGGHHRPEAAFGLNHGRKPAALKNLFMDGRGGDDRLQCDKDASETVRSGSVPILRQPLECAWMASARPAAVAATASCSTAAA